MSKKQIAVRIPEAMHKYIKFKSVEVGISQQDLIAEIIAQYQQNDSQYMARFNAYTAGNTPTDDTDVEVAHGI